MPITHATVVFKNRYLVQPLKMQVLKIVTKWVFKCMHEISISDFTIRHTTKHMKINSIELKLFYGALVRLKDGALLVHFLLVMWQIQAHIMNAKLMRNANTHPMCSLTDRFERSDELAVRFPFSCQLPR